MATMGGRAHYLVKSLPSLLNQTYPVDHVVVSISKYGDMDLMLRQLAQFGPFTNFTPAPDHAEDALSRYSTSAATAATGDDGNATRSASFPSPILIRGELRHCVH